MPSAHQDRRPVIRLTVVGLAIVVVLATSVYLIFFRQAGDLNLQTYIFTIRLEPNGSGNFSVRLPLVETSNETPSAIDENSLVLRALGSATGRIVGTPYGAAFEINGSERVELRVRFQKQLQLDWPYGYLRLSMCRSDCTQPGSSYLYASYLDSSTVNSVRVYANLTFEKITSRVQVKGFYLGEGVLANGWGDLEGLYRVMIT